MLDLDEWWLDVRARDKAQRLSLAAADPGYPATYGTCNGEPTDHPWGACIGAMNRLQKILDFNKTADSLARALLNARDNDKA